ncbi:hypothetical protein BDA96_02G080000 [Sorghum bicolor]|uniref:Uncharacterized protein n=1 Tax=Sorghum bicolor TaxID=4558 RepID=A0A921RKU6_SORBI|nr:hypothetical protein BDA96_02G080000 [Sorghum bicolor]
MRRQARGSGGCQATTPLLAVRRRKRGSAPPSSSPSSGQPPQCLIPLGTLCSFARRNPRSLCGGCSGGETQRLDLMVQEGQGYWFILFSFRDIRWHTFILAFI